MTRKATPAPRDDTASRVTREARIGQYGVGGASYPTAHDPDHRRAWNGVKHEDVDWAEVRDGTFVAFRAWRVSATSWAWQTATMSAPAFAAYGPHDTLEDAGRFGMRCPGCGALFRKPKQSPVYGMPAAEWNRYGI